MRKKKKLPKEPERPERYTIIDALHDSYMEFAIFDDDTEVAKGTIKWDNCSNWEVYEAHFCELKDMQEFHKALEKCYEIASQKMKNWLTEEIIRSW